jgi:hypothetical protein
MCGRLASELRYCCTARDLFSLETPVSLVAIPAGVSGSSWNQEGHCQTISAKQRRVQLRCGWLPVNRRVSREDPDRLNSFSVRPLTWPKKRLITFSMPMPDSTCCHASPACCHGSSVFANLEAIARGSSLALGAWIEEQAIPDVSELNLPDSTLETWSIRRM